MSCDRPPSPLLPQLPRHDGPHSHAESQDKPSLPEVAIVIRKYLMALKEAGLPRGDFKGRWVAAAMEDQAAPGRKGVWGSYILQLAG